MIKSLFRLETKLIKIENEHGIQRWKSDSPGYKSAEQILQRRKQNVLKQKVEVCARERWFLLAVKAKYAGKYRTLLQILFFYIMYTKQMGML